jgi:hypothetical protein
MLYVCYLRGAALCPQTLLTTADKYDMRVLRSRAGHFLQSSVIYLTTSSSSPQYVWKWIPLADRLGLSDVAKACITNLSDKVWADPVIDKLITDQPGRTELAGMSRETYQHLLKRVCAVAKKEAAVLRDEVTRLSSIKQQMKPGSAYCSDYRKLTEHKKTANRASDGSIRTYQVECCICTKWFC